MLTVKGWRIYVLKIPLRAPVRWANHAEDHIDVVLLEMRASNGARAVAEMAVRRKWHGETLEDCVIALDSQLLPALEPIDLQDDNLFSDILKTATQSLLARAIADMARADLLAQVEGLSLQQYFAKSFGTESSQVPSRAEFSCTITRDTPERMAHEAARLQQFVGARAFKIKTGQGLAIDTPAIAAIRKTSGASAFLSADSNSAGPPDIVATMADMLAEQDVQWFEDPCRLNSDERFPEICKASCVPVLVDNACRSLDAAQSFLGLGAQGLSIKLMKTGIMQSLAIALLAAKYNARATIGICAATSLSATYSLALFAALPEWLRAMPCEETFFVNLQQDITEAPLLFVDGAIVLPPAGPLADRLNWRSIEKLTA